MHVITGSSVLTSSLQVASTTPCFAKRSVGFSLCRCIPIWWKCDGQRDCSDGSDEPVLCPQRYCRLGQFQCKDGNCTSSHFLCNAHQDCPDGSDEDHILCGVFDGVIPSLAHFCSRLWTVMILWGYSACHNPKTGPES